MATVMDENGIRTVTKGDISHTYIAATDDGYGWASEPTEAAAIEAGYAAIRKADPADKGPGAFVVVRVEGTAAAVKLALGHFGL